MVHEPSRERPETNPHQDADTSPAGKAQARMSLENKIEDGVLTVFLKGRFDALSSATYGEELVGSLDSYAAVCLDLGQVDYISSAGLRVFLQLAKKAKAESKTISLLNVQPPVLRLFDMSGLNSLFDLGLSDERG